MGLLSCDLHRTHWWIPAYRLPGYFVPRQLSPPESQLTTLREYRDVVAPERTPHETEQLELGRLPSGTAIETTVHRYGHEAAGTAEDGDSGPTVYLQALQHGREVNGLEVLRRVHDRLLGERVRGQVVAVPVANPLSFDHRRYLAPQRLDALNANMNRLWPGDPEGTLLEGMVARLWSVAINADVVVDLHTGSPSMLSHTRYSPGDPRSRELAAAFGLDVILADGADVEAERQGGDRDADLDGHDGRADAPAVPDPGQGKLREVASRVGIPAITPELAHSRAIVEDSVERGVRGVENVLRHVGVLDGSVADSEPIHAAERTRVFARESGMFRASAVDVGEEVAAGTAIGEVYDPSSYEVLQTVEADRDGMLLTVRRGLATIEGEPLASVVELV